MDDPTSDAARILIPGNAPVGIRFSGIAMPGAMNDTELVTAARRLRSGLPTVLASFYAGVQSDRHPADMAVSAKPNYLKQLTGASHPASTQERGAYV